MENTEISNPILDEIPDACISDEMRKRLKRERVRENCHRETEVDMLRCQIAQEYEKTIHYSSFIQKLGINLFLDLTSSDILETHSSHLAAYEYCMEKAKRFYSKS